MTVRSFMRENPAPMAARRPRVASSTAIQAGYREPRTSRAKLEDGAQSVFQGRRVACSLQRDDLGTGLVVLRHISCITGLGCGA